MVETINQLPNHNFTFKLLRSPHVNFFSKRVSIPSVSVKSAEMKTSFRNLPLVGDKAEWEPLTIDFAVDEDMKNYLELFNWLVSVSAPDEYKQFDTINKKDKGYSLYSDGTLFIQTAGKNPNIEILFTEMNITSLSAIDFNVENTSVEYARCTATFEYQRFKFINPTSV